MSRLPVHLALLSPLASTRSVVVAMIEYRNWTHYKATDSTLVELEDVVCRHTDLISLHGYDNWKTVEQLVLDMVSARWMLSGESGTPYTYITVCTDKHRIVLNRGQWHDNSAALLSWLHQANASLEVSFKRYSGFVSEEDVYRYPGNCCDLISNIAAFREAIKLRRRIARSIAAIAELKVTELEVWGAMSTEKAGASTTENFGAWVLRAENEHDESEENYIPEGEEDVYGEEYYGEDEMRDEDFNVSGEEYYGEYETGDRDGAMKVSSTQPRQSTKDDSMLS